MCLYDRIVCLNLHHLVFLVRNLFEHLIFFHLYKTLLRYRKSKISKLWCKKRIEFWMKILFNKKWYSLGQIKCFYKKSFEWPQTKTPYITSLKIWHLPFKSMAKKYHKFWSIQTLAYFYQMPHYNMPKLEIN